MSRCSSIYMQPFQRALLVTRSRLSLYGGFDISRPLKARLQRVSLLEEGRDCNVILLTFYLYFSICFMLLRDTEKHTVLKSSIDMRGITENLKLQTGP